jgi:hypothetical protein
MKNKKKTVDPGLKQILSELEEIVGRLGYKTRYEKGNFEGGYCVLRDSMLIVVNSRNEAEKRISIVARCLKEIGIGDIFVKPHLREIIETESAKGIPSEEISAGEISDDDFDDSKDETGQGKEEIKEEAQKPGLS